MMCEELCERVASCRTVDYQAIALMKDLWCDGQFLLDIFHLLPSEHCSQAVCDSFVAM